MHTRNYHLFSILQLQKVKHDQGPVFQHFNLDQNYYEILYFFLSQIKSILLVSSRFFKEISGKIRITESICSLWICLYLLVKIMQHFINVNTSLLLTSQVKMGKNGYKKFTVW